MSNEKKSTQWITIPEVKQAHVADSAPQIKNKGLWAVGFVLVILVSYIFLAPGQFNSLFQGNLFDAQGVSEEDMKINLLPTKKSEENSSSLVNPPASEAAESSIDTSSLQQPQTNPVSVAVTPLTPEECASDLNCFLEKLQTCRLATAELNLSDGSDAILSKLQLTGENQGQCLVDVEVVDSTVPTLLNGKTSCQWIKGGVSANDLSNLYQEGNGLMSNCNGTLNNQLVAYQQQKVQLAEEQAKQQLIDDLTAQVEALNDQIAVNDSNLRPAANDPSATAPANNFRSNPYVVNQNPSQVLQQNLGNFTVNGSVGQPVVLQQNTVSIRQINPNLGQASVLNAGVQPMQTPETGPAEMVFAALMLSYIAFSGFKYFHHVGHR